MAQRKKRAKNEPTKGDILAQQYRNRAAMWRVFNAASAKHPGVVYTSYWTPVNVDEEVWLAPTWLEVK